MDNKAKISILKDYAELAWASYAMLHYIEENEITTQQIKKENEKSRGGRNTSLYQKIKVDTK